MVDQLQWNSINCADAIEGLASIPPSSVDCVLIDPPYNIGVNFGNSSCKKDITDYVEWCEQWLGESERILKDSGTLYIYGFSEILAHISTKVQLPHRWLIWHYTNRSIPSAKFWQRSHESIIVAWKPERIFNLDEVREPYTKGFLKGAAGKERKSTPGRYGKSKSTIYAAHKRGALPRDVIKISALAGGAGMTQKIGWCKDCKTSFFGREYSRHKDHPRLFLPSLWHKTFKHPTQKPLELTKKLLVAACPMEGASVVVPFAGTGSECHVANSLNMNYLGFDINQEYVTMANDFIKKMEGSPDETGAQLALPI